MLGGTPVAGANINFTVTKSNGSVAMMSGTTGADGSATVKYHLNKKDPRGIYQDMGATSVSGSSGSATASFVVQ